MKRKLLVLFLVLGLVSTMLVGCTQEPTEPDDPTPVENPDPDPEPDPEPEPEPETPTIIMITDTGGLGDKSFNDLSHAGLQKAADEYGLNLIVLQSASEDDYAPNIQSAIEEEPILIVCVGFLMEEATVTAAAENPDVNFALVDGVGDLDFDGQQDVDNLMALMFETQEGSFLVGVIAGLATESNTIGYIGGMEFPSIIQFESGFLAGVKTANPDAEILVQYADSFGDAVKGKEIAITQYNQGADVIYHVAGGVGLGLFQAATENNFWAIGVDADQALTVPESADNILCSMLKRLDTATYTAAKAAYEGTFEGQVLTFGLAEDGVGYGDGGDNLTEELKAAADKWAEAIKAGTFVIPITREEVETFEAPVLD